MLKYKPGKLFIFLYFQPRKLKTFEITLYIQKDEIKKGDK